MDEAPEKVLASTDAYRGVFLRVQKDEVRLASGKSAAREWIKHPGASVVAAKTEPGNFLLVRQWRHPLQRFFLEFPAGTRDGDEDWLSCARRELFEETGFETTTWKELGVIHPAIGYSNEAIFVFLAEGAKRIAPAPPDADEISEVLEFSPQDLVRAIGKEITDAKTLAVCALAGLCPSYLPR